MILCKNTVKFNKRNRLKCPECAALNCFCRYNDLEYVIYFHKQDFILFSIKLTQKGDEKKNQIKVIFCFARKHKNVSELLNIDTY